MNIYKIDYQFMKHGYEVVKATSFVKAYNAIGAWSKFENRWMEEFKAGRMDIPMGNLLQFSVESVCGEEEIY